MSTKLNLGVLVSGSGTNLQAILDAVSQGTLDANLRIVISNKPDAFALERAARAGVATATISHRDHPNRESFDAVLVKELRAAGVEWVVLAGFMRVLTPVFLDAFRDRVINIHPALLPAFPGVNAQRQAVDYGVKVSGCTVHFVDAGVDSGPIIAQRAVLVHDNDDESSLRARILQQEHQCLVESLQAIAEDRVRLLPSDSARAGDGERRKVNVRPA